MTNFLFIKSKNEAVIDGIFSYFREKQNPIPSTLIKATSSSTYKPTEEIQNILSDDSSIFTSNSETNASFIIEFVKHKIVLTEYTLKTVAYVSENFGKHFPRCWKIEGSNDKSHWKIIDYQSTDILNQPEQSQRFYTKYYDFYSFIRYTQTCANHQEAFNLRLMQIDFFGGLANKTNFLNQQIAKTSKNPSYLSYLLFVTINHHEK